MFAPIRTLLSRCTIACSSPRQRPKPRQSTARVEALEARIVFDGAFGDYLSAAYYSDATTPVSYETAFDYSDIAYDLSNAVLDPGFDFDVHGAIPQLNSNPGATHTLFLDFDGNFESFWASDGFEFTNTTMPGFDVDNIPDGYSAFERAIITNVFRYVAEDFAPFNVNVTTVDPGGWENADGRQLKVVLGRYQGDMVVSNTDEVSQSDWNIGQSGYGTLGGFSDTDSNTVFVFARNIWEYGDTTNPNFAAKLAGTASHEAGHCLGLSHVHDLDADGNITNVYGKGGADWTPIMGNNLATDRAKWTNGPIGSGNPAPMQDDAAVLGNVLGLRADDHASELYNATWLSNSSPPASIFQRFSGNGIIETTADVDAFAFTAFGRIAISLTANGAYANLDARMELLRQNADGTLAMIGTFAPDHSLGASASLNLDGGTYLLRVFSEGAAGDLGKYSLTIESAPEVILDDSWWTKVHVIPDYLVDPPWVIDLPFVQFEQALVPGMDRVEWNEPSVKLVEETPAEDPHAAVFAEFSGYESTPYFADDVAPSRNTYTSLRSSSVSRAATLRSVFATWI